MRGISQVLFDIISKVTSLIGGKHILLVRVTSPVLLIMSKLIILILQINAIKFIIIVTVLVIVILVVIVIVEVSIFISDLVRT